MRFPLNIFTTLEQAWDDAKTKPKGVFLFFVICIAVLVLSVLLFSSTLLCLGCVAILAGVLFPIFLKEWKAGFSLLLVLLGTVLLLQGQPWFQGFFKSNFISMFSSQMTRYGTKFEALTEAAQAMYGDLETNRIRMAALQQTIEAQQHSITNLYTESQSLLAKVQARQETVNVAVSNFSERISTQQKEIKNIDELIRGILVRKEEKFTLDDTNRIVFIRKNDTGVLALIRLDKEPILGFVDISFRNRIDDVGLINQFEKNIFTMTFTGDAFEQSVRPHGIIVRYIPDPAKKKMLLE